MFMVMNILLAACTREKEETVLSNLSPTVTAAVTQAPVSTQAVTPVPTKELELTLTPVPSPTEVISQPITPMPSPTITPTKEPIATTTVTPTPGSVVSATPTPRPTATPNLTVAPSPTMYVTPTPAKDPLTLVYEGWQQLNDPSGCYMVVFPDIYDTVNLTKEEKFFRYAYSASKMSDIQLDICFNIEENVELQEEKLIEKYPNLRIKLQTDGFAYYAETESLFVAGEVYAWNYEVVGTDGVMHIETVYPLEKKAEYQKEMYYWYVCKAQEE